MTFPIRCACGRLLTAPSEDDGPLTCPGCGRSYYGASSAPPPRVFRLENVEDETSPRSMVWMPIVRSTATCAVIVLALIWAIFAASGGGLGGSGEGTGLADSGAGTGTGDSGEGPGAGEAGTGTGAGTPGGAQASESDASPSGPVDESTDVPRPATPVKEVEVGLADPKIVPRPQPEPVDPSPGSTDAGASGAAGGGRGPGNAGDDPGARGDISFTIVWSFDSGRRGAEAVEGPDIDIWVIDPLSQTLSTSRDGFGLGPTPRGGGRIDYDDQGAYGPGNGGGPERVFWPDGQAPKGSYEYGVQYYEGIGTAKYTVRVYIGGKEIEKKTGILDRSKRHQPIRLGTVECR